jgi:predicted O-methyltransferase YrrM
VIARTSKPGSIRASGTRAQYVIADQRVELVMVPIRDGVTLIRRR